jgi:uncharacterized protein
MSRHLLLNFKLNVFFVMALLSAVALSTSMAFADSRLDSAKVSGQLGEQADGYLGLVNPGADAATKALMTEINAKRREEYKRIAEKNGTEIGAVQSLAGRKAIELTPSGQYVQGTNGWQKK